jgi:hypothetical protein
MESIFIVFHEVVAQKMIESVFYFAAFRLCLLGEGRSDVAADDACAVAYQAIDDEVEEVGQGVEYSEW